MDLVADVRQTSTSAARFGLALGQARTASPEKLVTADRRRRCRSGSAAWKLHGRARMSSLAIVARATEWCRGTHLLDAWHGGREIAAAAPSDDGRRGPVDWSPSMNTPGTTRPCTRCATTKTVTYLQMPVSRRTAQLELVAEMCAAFRRRADDSIWSSIRVGGRVTCSVLCR